MKKLIWLWIPVFALIFNFYQKSNVGRVPVVSEISDTASVEGLMTLGCEVKGQLKGDRGILVCRA